MYNRAYFILSFCVVSMLGACERSSPCADCLAEEPVEEPAVPDLPCDGADLEVDDLNCGACGAACSVTYVDTPYEVGHCSEGQCGPRWYAQTLDPIPEGHPLPELNCEEVCANVSLTCVAQGCSGKTGYSCVTAFGTGCSLTDEYFYPANWEGACADDIPLPDPDPGVNLKIGCCCGQ